MYELKYDPAVCKECQTIDCLTKCQYMNLDVETARQERLKIIDGQDSGVLTDCVTCYACEEYCPSGNHPFYLLVDRQEEKGVWPAPKPLTKQQILMMAPRKRIVPQELKPPVINMCFFPMLVDSIKGRIYEGATTFVGSDIFCNVMWLHFGKNSVIRERLPKMIENIQHYYLEPNGVDEIIHYHDECYATYTHLAPAFGIDVPFKSVHLFDFLVRRLDALRDQIRPLGYKVAYQRNCSNRLIPETQPLVDEIFKRIGVDRVPRKYDHENALCCAGPIRIQQRDDLADDVLKRNIDDMVAVGAQICVFNCPACLFTMGEAVAERGIMPMLMSDLCRAALGEK